MTRMKNIIKNQRIIKKLRPEANLRFLRQLNFVIGDGYDERVKPMIHYLELAHTY